MPQYPVLPVELQEMVVDEGADTPSLLKETACVNETWRRRSFKHLHHTLVVAATACTLGTTYLRPDGVVEVTDDAGVADTMASFDDILATIPSSYDNCVHTLILCGAPENKRIEFDNLGIELCKPDLTACTVKKYLVRFTKAITLEIRDVNWVDCKPTGDFCGCLSNVDKRAYRQLILRRVGHSYVWTNVTILAQTASSIEDLTVEALNVEGAEGVVYDAVPVDGLTLGIFSHPWRSVLPDVSASPLRRLIVSAMTWTDVPTVRELLTAHGSTLEEFSFRVWWYSEGLSSTCLCIICLTFG